MSLNENATKKLERTVILVNEDKIAGSPCVLDLGKCPVIRYSIVNGYKYDAGLDGDGGMRIGFRVAQNYKTTELSKTLKHICIECKQR